MEFNIGDCIVVKVGNKKLNGIVLNTNNNVLTVIYVGKNENGSAYAITDIFDKNGNLIDS